MATVTILRSVCLPSLPKSGRRVWREPACPLEWPVSVTSPGSRSPRQSHPGAGNVPLFVQGCESDVGLHISGTEASPGNSEKCDNPSPSHKSSSCDVSHELFGDSECSQQPNKLGCARIATSQSREKLGIGGGGSRPPGLQVPCRSLSLGRTGAGGHLPGFLAGEEPEGMWVSSAQQPG